MNPAGYRIEEKKLDAPLTPSSAYKSTHSSRSSVLERAREYNRRVEQKDAYEQHPQQQRRSKSLERRGSSHASGASASSNYSYGAASKRSHSVGRAVGISRTTTATAGNQPATRERAMASVRREQEIGISRQPTRTNHNNAAATTNKPAARSGPPQDPAPGQQQQQQQQQGDAAVTPELLVDALSGHEDGLLAIAEKLMEHYDQGYDVMGEAIIDAFADVQKLFQHVVEAAHMEGAAFEASRRDEELEQLRRQVASQPIHDVTDTTSPTSGTKNSNGNNSGGPPRHDEFIDQDVKDVLTEAIRQGTALRDSTNHTSSISHRQQQQAQEQCCRIYERACQNASSLLPVDSDHRGRLQLSIARAESMSAERACAILRYAMDDVLRSGQRALMTQHTPLTEAEVRQRADVVLNRSTSSHSPHAPHSNAVPGVVHQSSDEALASLREEMKEILSAPIYHDTPLQHVAQRFWKALQEADKVQKKHAERLEQNLGKLKGEFLLARAEWEEKLNKSNEMAETYKHKYQSLKERSGGSVGSAGLHHSGARGSHSVSSGGGESGSSYLEQARSFASRLNDDDVYGSVKSVASGRAETVASGVSEFAAQARTLVMNTNFNCAAPPNKKAAGVDDGDDDDAALRDMAARYGESRSGQRSTPPSNQQQPQDRSRSRSKNSRSFRNYSKSPQRCDV